MPELADLSLSEWVVLALLAEAPAHGFALARGLAAGTEIGSVWRVPKPQVYRALDHLAGLGLASADDAEPGEGPERRPYRATGAGSSAVRRWLGTPVTHIRDVRTAMLVKLLLLERRGWSRRRLVLAQQAAFADLLTARAAETGTGAVALWRKESAASVARYLGALGRLRP